MSEEPPKIQKDGFENLRNSIDRSIASHGTGLDGWMYNGGTILILVLTAAVSILSGNVIDIQSFKWLPSVLSALAGLFVALERSLGFGPRWRFHTEMKAGYQTVRDLIDYYFIIPEDEKDQKARIRSEIWQSLNALRSRESALPTSGGSITDGS